MKNNFNGSCILFIAYGIKNKIKITPGGIKVNNTLELCNICYRQVPFENSDNEQTRTFVAYLLREMIESRF